MAQRFPTRRTTSPNRSWAGIVSSAPLAVPAASKVLVGSFVNPASNDATILRTVGVIGIRSDELAADEIQVGAFGMVLVTDVALAAGIASIPGPVTDIENDGWFIFQGFTFSRQVFSSTGVNDDETHMMVVDSKAKRKLGDGTSVAVVVENAHATHGFQITIALRMLQMVSGTG